WRDRGYGPAGHSRECFPEWSGTRRWAPQERSQRWRRRQAYGASGRFRESDQTQPNNRQGSGGINALIFPCPIILVAIVAGIPDARDRGTQPNQRGLGLVAIFGDDLAKLRGLCVEVCLRHPDLRGGTGFLTGLGVIRKKPWQFFRRVGPLRES